MINSCSYGFNYMTNIKIIKYILLFDSKHFIFVSIQYKLTLKYCADSGYTYIHFI